MLTLSEYDDFWGEADFKIYANEDGDGIGVIVASYLLGYTLDDLKDNLEDCEEKTINNIDGLYSEQDDGKFFIYIVDDKAVMVFANNDELFEKVIK